MLSNKPLIDNKFNQRESRNNEGRGRNERFERGNRRERAQRGNTGDSPRRQYKHEPIGTGMERFRIEIGHEHQVKPSNIVGAIANEAGIDGEHIGRIDIRDEHSFVDLPVDMPKDTFNNLKKVWVAGQQLNISRDKGQKDSFKKVPHRKGNNKSKDNSDGFSSKHESGKKPKKTKSKPKSRIKANGEQLGGTKFSKKDKKK